MKIYRTFLLSVAVIACCIGIYARSVHIESGINYNAYPVSHDELMQGNDSGNTDKIQLFYGETVNINTADAKRLALLPGIGEELSERIVEYRAQNGCFESIGDIMKVEGIGEGRFEAIRDLITTEEMSDENSGS